MIETIHILLIEDSAMDRYVVERLLAQLTEYHCEITIADDFDSSSQALAQPFDICLMDFNIGKHSAFELLDAHDVEHLPGPVLFLTGEDSDSIEQEAAKRGVFDYLSKPDLTKETLKRAIRYSLQRHSDLRKLAYTAQHDGLTQLLNRTAFITRLEARLADAPQAQEQASIIFFDIDGFKAVNDSLGHDAGDQLIRHVAQSLTNCVRGSDLVARFGGDELVAAIFSVQFSDIEIFISRIRSAIAVPIFVGGNQASCTVSAGIARVSSASLSVEEIIRRADCALIAAKNRGRNQHLIYTASLETIEHNRAVIDLALRQAIADDKLSMVYEPQINVATNEIVGFEALLRWTDAEKGAISPSEFVPIAEETGTIAALDHWAMMRVTAEIADLLQSGALSKDQRFSINVSIAQLTTPQYTEALLARLAELGLPTSMLMLEITEQDVVDNIAGATDQLAKLRAAGLRIALDDFGAGQSSLSRLMALEVDALKLDVDILSHVDTNRRAKALVGATIMLGQGLDAEIIAEGIERSPQVTVLQDLQCTTMQGWLISKGLNKDGIKPFLDEWSTKGSS